MPVLLLLVLGARTGVSKMCSQQILTAPDILVMFIAITALVVLIKL